MPPAPTHRAPPIRSAPRTSRLVHRHRPAGPAPIAGRRSVRSFLACAYSSVCDDRSMGCSTMSSTCSSSWCECLRGLRAAWPLDVALDVVARSVATDECPAELDRGVVTGERDAFDQERCRAAALAQQAGLARAQEDRLQGLAGADDRGPVARRHELVQGGVLEIAGEESREALGRQVD